MNDSSQVSLKFLFWTIVKYPLWPILVSLVSYKKANFIYTLDKSTKIAGYVGYIVHITTRIEATQKIHPDVTYDQEKKGGIYWTFSTFHLLHRFRQNLVIRRKNREIKLFRWWTLFLYWSKQNPIFFKRINQQYNRYIRKCFAIYPSYHLIYNHIILSVDVVKVN